MKKILTLMAAMAAAGSAMAADYVWTVDASGVNGNGKENVTFDQTAKTYTFSVNAGEKVWVKGTGIVVKQNNTKLNGVAQTFDMEGEGMLYTPAAGNVSVAGATIEKIKVVSSASMQVEEKFQEVQEAINTANQQTALWAEDEFATFFTKVRAAINEQGAENQAVRAKLEKRQEENNVEGNVQDLITRLDAAIAKIKQTVTDAQGKKALYDAIVGTDAKALKDQLKKGKNGPQSTSEINNDALTYINDYKAVDSGSSEKVVLTGSKTDWVATEWDKFTTEDIAAIKTEAMGQLNSFPNGFTDAGKTEADFQARYADLQQAAKNVIARAIFERDNKDNILALNKQMARIETVAATENAPFKLPETPEYEHNKEIVSELVIFVNADNDRRKIEQNDLNALITGSYTTAKNLFDAAEAAFVTQAVDDLTAKTTATQKNIDETSYKVSAKYVNEPKTQEKKEKEFAKIQNTFDKQKTEWVKAANYTKTVTADIVVETYQKYVAECKDINDQVDNMWTETLSAQKIEVLENNQKEAKELLANIEKVRKTYDDNVPRIKKWIDADWTDSSDDTDMNANLKQLFSKAGNIDEMRETVISDTLRYTNLINETKDIEFDANDNKYRLLKGEKDKYYAELATIEDDILDEIKHAVYTANKAAADYLNGTPKTNAEDYILKAKDARQGYNLWMGDKEELMSASAVELYQKEYDKVGYLDAEGNGLGYINKAIDMIDAGYTGNYSNVDIDTQKLADMVEGEDGVLAVFNKVPDAIAVIDAQLADYKALYKSIYEQKVEWSLTKANAGEKQAAIDALEGDINVVEKLKELNEWFDGEDGAYTKLEANPTNATALKEDIQKTIEDFKEALYEINNYDVIVKDKTAKAAADTQLADVTTKLNEAYTAIADFKEDVKATATIELNAAKTTLENLTTKVATAFANHTLDANYENGDNLKLQIEQVATDIAATVEKAQKDNVDVPGDQNGDKKVDSADAAIVIEKVGNRELSVKDYNEFLKALDEYNAQH